MQSTIIRVTSILIENNSMLLIKQKHANTNRKWSLPGGKVEFQESLEDALCREVKEEIGLDVKPKNLLYIADYFPDDLKHILHITFLVTRVGGEIRLDSQNDTIPIEDIKFVPLSDLVDHGFSTTFQELALNNFPGAGSYVGPKTSIGL